MLISLEISNFNVKKFGIQLNFNDLKDDEQIVPEEWIRYRSTGGGSTLKISTTEPSDSGRYLCRAINGFGAVDVTISLIVDTGKRRLSINLFSFF